MALGAHNMLAENVSFNLKTGPEVLKITGV